MLGGAGASMWGVFGTLGPSRVPVSRRTSGGCDVEAMRGASEGIGVASLTVAASIEPRTVDPPLLLDWTLLRCEQV